ncbi:C6 zinc finger domain containing protein [Colletotrichum tofieldiae]|uniref:C6 zinc finger domain containing protein n=1 Tax=Colletotrichum tofieldiae TaxID=708197 RepID=A0A166LZC0_9PEZI|nr:C6 zinc finger domain containing protein [Colletotrichum tofieldiae]
MPLDGHRQRPLLPRTAQQLPQEPNPTDGDDGNSNGRKRRRSHTSKACNFCRDKKKAVSNKPLNHSTSFRPAPRLPTDQNSQPRPRAQDDTDKQPFEQCDGQPECSQCLRRGLKCEYRVVTDTILKAIPAGFQLVDKQQSLSNADAADLLEILKTVPEDEALEGLQLLRTGNDPALICSALRGYDAGLSSAALNRAILPPTQSSLEFELMMRHPVAYPAWPPFQPSKLDLDFMLLPREVLWSHSGPAETADSSSPYTRHPRRDSLNFTGRVGPRNPSTLYDNRLLSVDITQWTDVPITNEFSIAVLQLYLETDYPMMPLIDVDLLLDGLLGKNEFCSRILVSGLFAWACQGYTAFEPEATVVGHYFYVEAKELWKRSKEARVEESICTVAAVQYLLMTSVSLGAGAQYVELLDDLLNMSKRLELFNVSPSHDSRLNLDSSANYRKAKSQISWVLFAYLTIYHHLAIIDLFRPLLQHNGAPRQRLPNFESEESTPDAVYAASVKQLKRIVLFYRHSHPESSYSFFWHSALLYLANAMLAEAKVPGHAPDWLFYLRLCITCYQTLYTGFPLAKGITLSLLSMALEKGAMDIPQTRAIRRDLELRGKHHMIPDQVPVYWVVDLDLALTDPFAAHAENLVQRFRKLHLRETSETNES